MKVFLAVSLLLVLVVSGISARSLSDAAVTFEKGSLNSVVGDIWSNCGKA